MARYKNIAYIANREGAETGHVSTYFIAHSENFYGCEIPILHHNQPTLFKHYNNGKLVRNTSVWPYKGKSKILLFFFYYWSFLLFLAEFKISHTTIIVSSPLFAFLNSLNRLLLHNRTIFWIFDYFPNPKGTTYTHHLMTNFYNNHMHIVLYLSQALAQVYTRKNVPKKYLRKVIELGIMKQTTARNPQKNILGYIGNLCEGKGLYLLLEAAALAPDVRFEIIGNGPLRKALEKFAKNLKIEGRVSFFDFVSNEHLSTITNRWTAGLALYEHGNLNYADYTDPGKVKLYIELGIPVIMTATSPMHTEISSTHAGVVVPCNVQHLMKAMRKIQDNQSMFTEGVEKVAKKYRVESHYKTAFEFLEHTL